MSNKIKLIILSLVLSVSEARAASSVSSLDGAPGIDLTLDKLKDLITGLACWLVDIALVLIVLAVVFYGVQFLISQGDPTKVGNARKGLTWGVVGIAVILGTYTIIATVAYYIGAEVPNIMLGCS